MSKSKKPSLIAEKRLGISPDYQHKALHSKNFLQANWHNNKWQTLKSKLKLNKNITVLDLGPGSGNFEFLFHSMVKSITAIDYNDDALNFLGSQLKVRHIKNVRLIHSDIRDLAKVKRLGRFDLIIMIDVIEHIKIAQAKTLVDIMQNNLNPEGRVCIITPNYNSSWKILEKILDKMRVLPHFEGEQHLAKFHKTNLTEIFEKSGFKTKTMRTFNLFSFIAPTRRSSQKLSLVELKIPWPIGNLLFAVFELPKKR